MRPIHKASITIQPAGPICVHHRPIAVGDVLIATATVTGVRSARGGRMIGFDTVLRDPSGAAVQSLSSALLTAEVEG